MMAIGAAAASTEVPPPVEDPLAALAGHPHARAVLAPALPPGEPSHAYLLHGPAGSGKRFAARAFAAALLADGAGADCFKRAWRGSHPDLTWVAPSGAAEMLVGDVDKQVVSAIARTPFESKRRVFVLEGADRMNAQAANRLLKTLEEPPAYAHLLLIAERLDQVLPTVRSRCIGARFEALARDQLAERLQRDAALGRLPALACAGLAEGDGSAAAFMASAEGQELRDLALELLYEGEQGRWRRWAPLLAVAKQAGERAAEAMKEQALARAELLPSKERARALKESAEAERRGKRRAGSERLDLGLRLACAWLRDTWLLALGAEDAIAAVDARPRLEALLERARSATDADAAERLRQALELVAMTRSALRLNVSEELALEALAQRLAALLGG